MVYTVISIPQKKTKYWSHKCGDFRPLGFLGSLREEPCHALAASNLQRFSEHRAGRQGDDKMRDQNMIHLINRVAIK